ncbi:hypothetical protein [Apilactobacillus xinyiensis]|uniref:hypothetical protein n=1 Tax=Apilactobacillus xinyiensis TaxID=2841032 RepID=UPI00200EE37A|nr:hypothetical protein [Apilactobacillus xinyiensis]MCL0330592.1 hypothetical protein [Apilactobacillus xinyiensis]
MLERMLFDYPELEHHLKNRIEELKYPVVEKDDNVGGGKSNKVSNPIESFVITIDEDKVIHGFRKQQIAIQEALGKLDLGMNKTIKRYYFDNEANNRSARSIAKEYGYSKSEYYRQRDFFYKRILDNLGLPHLAKDI